MLSHTIGEAERLGMKVDMNTGTGWPFGGPGVTVADAATKVQFKEYEVEGGARTELEITRPLRLYAFSDKGRKCDLTSLVDDEGGSFGRTGRKVRLIALFTGKTCQQVKRAAPGGEGLVMDHFNPTAVKNYLSRFDDAFSRSGAPRPNRIFQRLLRSNGQTGVLVSWITSAKRRGYRLEEYLPNCWEKGRAISPVGWFSRLRGRAWVRCCWRILRYPGRSGRTGMAQPPVTRRTVHPPTSSTSMRLWIFPNVKYSA